MDFQPHCNNDHRTSKQWWSDRSTEIDTDSRRGRGRPFRAEGAVEAELAADLLLLLQRTMAGQWLHQVPLLQQRMDGLLLQLVHLPPSIMAGKLTARRRAHLFVEADAKQQIWTVPTSDRELRLQHRRALPSAFWSCRRSNGVRFSGC
ncbi:hypothetical protein M9H77_21293 [Catharanthus roseus]|uniref:Uncharacterized protein n=1 Tax=Catharanthus roseus TaxID=4058 RepID=A0ACC0ANY9_CATRO|nr:hypothetical protein M9H77_21293 [Catharanthus roseus]